jgi:hypothetical protein
MRDPERISRICKKLEQAWKMCPDERMGQFVSNLLGAGRHDVFYQEDIVWEQLLDSFKRTGE